MRSVAVWSRILVVTLCLIASHAPRVLAGFSVGGSFAAPGYGARAWGRAGAAIASGADEGSVYWNPAMLSLIDQRRLGLAYTNLIPGTDARQSFVAYAQSLKAGAVDEPGLGYAEHAIGAIFGNLALELSDGQSYNENTFRVSYAYSPLYYLTFAVSFAGLFTSSDVQGFGGNGTALDVSIRIAIMRELTFGAVVRNGLSQIEFDDGTNYSLPRSYTLGLSYRVVQSLLIEGDIEAQFGGFSKLVLGGDYTVYHDMLAIRAGLATVTVGENRTIAYLGAGVQVRQFTFDYAVDLDSDEALENTQRLSLGIGF